MNFDQILESIMLEFNATTNKELAALFNTTPQYISQIKSKKNLEILKKLAIKGNNDTVKRLIFQKIDEQNDNSVKIEQKKNSRAAGRDYKENTKSDFDELTVALLKKLIQKFGDEDKLQFEFMQLLQK